MHSINITLLLLVMQINFFTSSHAKPVYHSSESKVLPDKSNPEAEDAEYKYFISRNESWREEERKYVTDLPALIRPLWISALEYNDSVGLEYVPVEGELPVVGKDRLWIRTGRNVDREMFLGVEQKRDDSQDEEDGTVIDEQEEVWTTVEEVMEQWSEDGWTNEVLEGDEPKVVKWSKRESSVKDCLDKDRDTEIGGEFTPLPEIEMDHEKDDMDDFTTVVPVTEEEGIVVSVTVTMAPEELEADVDRSTMVTKVKVTTETSEVTTESWLKTKDTSTEATEEMTVHKVTEAIPAEIGDQETAEDIATIVPEDSTLTMSPEDVEVDVERSTMVTEVKVTTEPSEVTKEGGVKDTQDTSTEPTEEIIVHEVTDALPVEIGGQETNVMTTPIAGKGDIATIVPEDSTLTMSPEDVEVDSESTTMVTEVKVTTEPSEVTKESSVTDTQDMSTEPTEEITVQEVTEAIPMEFEDEVGKHLTWPSYEELDELVTVVAATEKEENVTVTAAIPSEDEEAGVDRTTIPTQVEVNTVGSVTTVVPTTDQEIPEGDFPSNIPEIKGESDNKDIQEITTKPTEKISVKGVNDDLLIEFGDEVRKKMSWPSYQEMEVLEDNFLRVEPLSYRDETMKPRQPTSISDSTSKHPLVERSTQSLEEESPTDSYGIGSEDREEIGPTSIPESSQTEGMAEVFKEDSTVTSTHESLQEVKDSTPIVAKEPKPDDGNPEILSPIGPRESELVAPIEEFVPVLTPLEAKKMVGPPEDVQEDAIDDREGEVKFSNGSDNVPGASEASVSEGSKGSFDGERISEVGNSVGDPGIMTTLHLSPELGSGEMKTPTASGNVNLPSETSTAQGVSTGSVQVSDISVQGTEGSEKDSVISQITPEDTSPESLPETITAEEVNKDLVQETEGSVQENEETELKEDSTTLESVATLLEETKSSSASSSSILPETTAQEIPVTTHTITAPNTPAETVPAPPEDSPEPETTTPETESGASKSLLIHELIFVFSVLSWAFTVLLTA